MTSVDMPDFSGFDASRLAEARRQLRSAVLWPARVAASYSAAATPSLTWDVKRSAILTCIFENTLQLELRPADLNMQFLENGNPVPHILDIDDRSPAHVEAWILVELLHRGVDRQRFSKALGSDVQHLMSGDHEKFAPLALGDELAALSQCLASAGSVLARLAPAAEIAVSVPDASLSVPGAASLEGDGGPRKVVAFSLGDAANPEPYFSVARATVGTVTPLRPEVVLPASQLRGREMSADAIAQRLGGSRAIDAA